MENPAVRKKIPDLQRLIFNFQVPVFQCQGCKQWISQNLYYLAVSICLRTWVNWIVELPTISTAFLPGEFSSTPPALARAANESAHVTPQTKQQTRISLKFVGLRSEVWGLRYDDDDDDDDDDEDDDDDDDDDDDVDDVDVDAIVISQGKLLIPHWHVINMDSRLQSHWGGYTPRYWSRWWRHTGRSDLYQRLYLPRWNNNPGIYL